MQTLKEIKRSLYSNWTIKLVDKRVIAALLIFALPLLADCKPKSTGEHNDVNRHWIGTPDRLPKGTPRWARSGTRPGGAVRVAEPGRVPLR